MNTRTLLIAAALAAALVACIPNDASIRLYGLCSPPTPSDAGGCLYPAKCDTLALGRLEADVSSPSLDGPLVWPVQVNNQRPPNKDRAGGVETAFATIEGYKIKYSSSAVAVPEQDVRALPGEHPVDPNGNTVVLVPVVTRAAGTFISGFFSATVPLIEITAEIKAYGKYGDGSTFETGPLHVEATLCDGCFADPRVSPLLYCPADKPAYLASCPQEFQSSIVKCTSL